MSDQKLEQLKDLPIPEPRPGAEERALRAAVAAFERREEKFERAPQGESALARLIASSHEAWRWTMERRVMIGGVAAAVIALPLAAQLMLNSSLTPFKAKTPAAEPVAVAPVRESAEARSVRIEAERQAAVDRMQSRLRQEQMADQAANSAAQNAPTVSGRSAGLSQDALRHYYAPSAPGVSGYAPSAPGVVAVLPPSAPGEVWRSREPNRDRFADFSTNGLKSTLQEPVSTFSIDVDTASYAFVRRMLEGGQLPPKDAVRVEEMINYFAYDYPAPEAGEAPFKATVAVYPTPWNAATKLMHIGIKGHDVVPAEKPRSNLVFLIDVSGSMSSPDKLPLLKSAMRLLIDGLGAEDSVAIVTYAGAAGTVLEPTKATDKHKILSALDRLEAGGSTAGAQGIAQAYALAQQGFDAGSVNRVILATDGDFNVGLSSPDALKALIEEKRRSGIFLSVLGVGQGNYNDALMQALAQNGNGTAAYIDTLREAQKVLVEEASANLFPIAKDVKIQVEFNPATVAEYRLIGYETRILDRADFNNDRVDAGDIGSGHTVTAIYEITPVGSTARRIDDLRYAPTTATPAPAAGMQDEYAFLKLRYKLPNEDESRLLAVPVTKAQERSATATLSDDMRFAAAVAAFGQKLRGTPELADFGYDRVLTLAEGARGRDRYGYRGEFLTLVRLAKSMSESSMATQPAPR